MDKQTIICALYDIGAIKVGNFVLASGKQSSVYIDLRPLVSHPSLLLAVSESLFALVKSIQAELLCGVPYTALPIATCMSIQHDLPMVMVRKEPKGYGTKRLVEGDFQPGQRCLMVEDLVTTGGSVLKVINTLETEGLQVTDCVVFLDREQGGKAHVMEQGYHLHAVVTISEMFHLLKASNKLSMQEILLADQFLATIH